MALGRASASERASAVESRCRDGGRFRCVCDACPQERERDRITLLLARRHRNSSQFRVSRPSRKRKAWPREIAPADSSRDRSCSPARPASIDRAPCEITWTLVIRFIAPLPKFAPKSLSGYLFDAQLLAVVHKLDFSRFHLFDRVVVDWSLVEMRIFLFFFIWNNSIWSVCKYRSEINGGPCPENDYDLNRYFDFTITIHIYFHCVGHNISVFFYFA